jgi:Fe-S cluster assembly ATP-binding protein
MLGSGWFEPSLREGFNDAAVDKGVMTGGNMEEEILRITGLRVSVDGTEIIKGLDLSISIGEIHAIMGRNGAGKSTLANVIMGHPAYEITSGTIHFRGQPLEKLEVFERARAGMFLSFQYPSVIPGVQVGTFLRKSVQAIRGEKAPTAREFRTELKTHMEVMGMDRSFLARYVNDGFSGGEKKRLEILQMLLLTPRLALLDETDSGLDIDALKVVAAGINSIAPEAGCLLITHYQRLLEHVKPDYVHVMIDGRIVKTGGAELAGELEEKGYEWLENMEAK